MPKAPKFNVWRRYAEIERERRWAGIFAVCVLISVPMSLAAVIAYDNVFEFDRTCQAIVFGEAREPLGRFSLCGRFVPFVVWFLVAGLVGVAAGTARWLINGRAP